MQELAVLQERLERFPELGHELRAHDGHALRRMAPHFDQILGTPSATFYLGGAARTHQIVAEDYASYPERFRTGTRVPYQAHGKEFMEVVANGLQSLPRIFTDLVLPKLPKLQA